MSDIRSSDLKMKRQRKVTVLLTEPEYVTYERYCGNNGCKKSTLLAQLMRQHLEKENIPIPQEDETSYPTAAKASGAPDGEGN